MGAVGARAPQEPGKQAGPCVTRLPRPGTLREGGLKGRRMAALQGGAFPPPPLGLGAAEPPGPACNPSEPVFWGR